LPESVIVNNSLSIDEQYVSFVKQVKALLVKEDNWLSNLSNFTAALKQGFGKISWAGFYLYDGNRLYLGPFQGKVACTNIEMNKGVCGTAAQRRETVIVPDVNKFPGHIACDGNSRSEIVIPLVKNGKLIGLLDLDSAEYNSFDETDEKYLQELCLFLIDEILPQNAG